MFIKSDHRYSDIIHPLFHKFPGAIRAMHYTVLCFLFRMFVEFTCRWIHKQLRLAGKRPVCSYPGSNSWGAPLHKMVLRLINSRCSGMEGLANEPGIRA